MNRTMKDKTMFGQVSSNGILWDDIWSNVVKIAEEANAQSVEYVGPVNTSHRGFFPAKLKN